MRAFCPPPRQAAGVAYATISNSAGKQHQYLVGLLVRPQVVLFQRDVSTGELSSAEAFHFDSATFFGLGMSGAVNAFTLSGTKLFVSIGGDSGGLVVLDVSCATPSPTQGDCAIPLEAPDAPAVVGGYNFGQFRGDLVPADLESPMSAPFAPTGESKKRVRHIGHRLSQSTLFVLSFFVRALSDGHRMFRYPSPIACPNRSAIPGARS